LFFLNRAYWFPDKYSDSKAEEMVAVDEHNFKKENFEEIPKNIEGSGVRIKHLRKIFGDPKVSFAFFFSFSIFLFTTFLFF
jgi:hypothetical protein